MTTRRSFLKNLAVGIGAALITANLEFTATSPLDVDVGGSLKSAFGNPVPLRVESLERTLKHVTFRMDHVKMWRDIPKQPIYNAVEEYNALMAHAPLRVRARRWWNRRFARVRPMEPVTFHDYDGDLPLR